MAPRLPKCHFEHAILDRYQEVVGDVWEWQPGGGGGNYGETDDNQWEERECLMFVIEKQECILIHGAPGPSTTSIAWFVCILK